jgi:hypothetical protein
MIVLLMLLGLVVVVVYRVKRRKRAAVRNDTPLGGFDTGARWSHRYPSRRFRPHRGF